jgi:hypothetical protein
MNIAPAGFLNETRRGDVFFERSDRFQSAAI